MLGTSTRIITCRALKKKLCLCMFQDFPPGDIRAFGASISAPGRHSLAQDRYVHFNARSHDLTTGASVVRPGFSSRVPAFFPLSFPVIPFLTSPPIQHIYKKTRESQTPTLKSSLAALHHNFSQQLILFKQNIRLLFFVAGEMRDHGNSDCVCADIFALYHNRLLTVSLCVCVCACVCML